MSLRLDWCSEAAAEYAVSHWHYSRILPPHQNRIGVWEHSKFIGCVVFSRGGNRNLLKPYGLSVTEGCELVRVALTKHDAPVSRIVAIAVRMLRAHSPGIKLIVSFADPAKGHIGGIYQALNWVYLGITGPGVQWIGPTGTRLHNRTASVSPLHRASCRRTRIPGKYRYAYALDPQVRALLQSRAQPYPKRGRSAENGTAVPTAGGGVNSDPPAP